MCLKTRFIGYTKETGVGAGRWQLKTVEVCGRGLDWRPLPGDAGMLNCHTKILQAPQRQDQGPAKAQEAEITILTTREGTPGPMVWAVEVRTVTLPVPLLLNKTLLLDLAKVLLYAGQPLGLALPRVAELPKSSAKKLIDACQERTSA
mmetsp:Transcript_52076/g.92850  ORF Transcript_52076/g.92850 Transcript_52076/m.92850 type:complete len:148 (+) Transcript_52076:1101-1544(+)